jgi:biotin synthase-related radical SAM superfamily protein
MGLEIGTVDAFEFGKALQRTQRYTSNRALAIRLARHARRNLTIAISELIFNTERQASLQTSIDKEGHGLVDIAIAFIVEQGFRSGLDRFSVGNVGVKC